VAGGGAVGGRLLVARLAVAVQPVQHQPVLVELRRRLDLLAPPALLRQQKAKLLVRIVDEMWLDLLAPSALLRGAERRTLDWDR